MCANVYDQAMRANLLGNRRGGTVALIETCFIISFSFFFLISIPDVSLEITRTPGGKIPIISPIYFDLEYSSTPKMGNRIWAFLSIIVNFFH